MSRSILLEQARQAFLSQSQEFARLFTAATIEAQSFEALHELCVLRKKAIKKGIPFTQKQKIKIALLGAYTFQPLAELIEQVLFGHEIEASFYQADFDTYVPEILNQNSSLYAFAPEVIFIIPSSTRITALGAKTTQVELQQYNEELLNLCDQAFQKTGASIVLANYLPLPFHDLGALKSKLTSSDWQAKRFANFDLGARAKSHISICDLDFLAYRMGGLQATDERAWFQSKQIGASDFLAQIALEFSQTVVRLKQPMRKVLVLDLDNTLWGGVIGDDGLEGIEIGDTSPRGEAFKAFQKAVLELKERGVLLAVCSKNDFEKATEPFEKHPEMLIRKEDLVSFKASWGPKSEALRQMALELNLGLDSFVFADDNPAEIEIVRQFAPDVKTLWLEDEPANFVRKLKECRYFDPLALTAEDLERTQMYQAEAKRKELQQSVTDMGEYLRSLQMTATIQPFQAADVQRIAQLINKSNQFNLTTKRRSEAEIQELIKNPNYSHFTIRLSDKFGDHGLIAVVVLENKPNQASASIDTWLMSCRVLERQVEELTLNTIFSIAQKMGAKNIFGEYIMTKKNSMVAGLYLKFGFKKLESSPERSLFSKDVSEFSEYKAPISTQGALAL